MQRFRSANIVSLKTAHVGGKMKYLRDKKAVLKGYFVIVSQYRQNFKSVSFLMIHNLQGSKQSGIFVSFSQAATLLKIIYIVDCVRSNKFFSSSRKIWKSQQPLHDLWQAYQQILKSIFEKCFFFISRHLNFNSINSARRFESR